MSHIFRFVSVVAVAEQRAGVAGNAAALECAACNYTSNDTCNYTNNYYGDQVCMPKSGR